MNVSNVRTPLLPREVDWEDIGGESYACGRMCLCCEDAYCSEDRKINGGMIACRAWVGCYWGLITFGAAFNAQPDSRGVLISSAIGISFYALNFFSNCSVMLATHCGFEKTASIENRLRGTCIDLIGIALFLSALIINQSKV
ncbi:MAG: hypothetical protein K1000chlam2_01123 [Chlamydiae bacterium]|nr:hypothetical protein [Chlamydiota bacterium]